MTAPVLVLNGPNLNMLGLREPEIYGHTTLAEIEATCREAARGPLEFRQSNIEGELVGWVQDAVRDDTGGIVINPAGYTFTSVALLDALKMFPGPVIELHISNVHARGGVYAKSLVSPVATAVIAGLGARGYVHALAALYELMGE